MTNKTKPSKKAILPIKSFFALISKPFLAIKRRFLNAWSKSKNFLKHLYSYWGNARITILGIVIFAVFYQSISYVRMESPPVWRINLICLQVLLFLLLLLISLKENIEIIKRIYRNSEGFVIPLLGGTATLLTFQAVSLFRSASTPEEKAIIIDAWFIFITIEIVVGIVLYSIKKANLKDDAVKSLEQILIKHYNPYDYEKDSDSLENIKKKIFYYLVKLNEINILRSLDKYLNYKNFNFLFNKNEIKAMEEKIIKNINIVFSESMQRIPNAVKIKLKNSYSDGFFKIIKSKSLKKLNIFIILKEGREDNPKNFNNFEADINKINSPFIVFENLKPSKDEKRFLDINVRQIACVDYQEDKVILTVVQPNASPRKILVSLSEWLAHRNDLT